LLYSSTKEGNSLGGAFLISKEKYKLSGFENETFYGWGVDDGERYHRWMIFHFSAYRSKGALFHLSHPRDINGTMRSDYHEAKTNYEYAKVMNSTREELKNRLND
jgi:hypothetical protein